MATKYICDGCDRDIGDAIKRNEVGVAVGGISIGIFDLCNSCFERVKEVANPTKWHRLEEPK